ncbi:C10 family peptidase [uncultured Alistipes sp.]|jgi:hypothetical protein|uniref:C10 family peptidase n=1 Tax=uncultured Alistipes sp. TaxID=538949 RepID=UPI0026173D5A|nr:C10 family peptidase [uncultured Alistipes sp.]
MKKFFLLLSILALSGCLREESETLPTAQTTQVTTPVRPVSEALAELNAMLQEVHAATRTAKQTYDVSDVVAIGGAAATRSSDTPALPDTLVYVVNFDGDNGFAVLGAHRALAPVFAITENGNLDPRTLERKIGQAYDCFVSGQAAESVTRADDSEYTDHDASYPPIVPELLGRSIAAYSLDISDWGNTPKPTFPNDFKLVKTNYGDWEAKKKVGPLVETKWGQSEPFNMSCPTHPFYLQKKCAVGCVMVAIGQIMASNQRPTRAPAGNNISYGWAGLKSISNYTNVHLYYNYSEEKAELEQDYTTRTNCKYLAKFLAYLGSKECCNANYGIETGAKDADAQRTMRVLDPAFYEKATVQVLSEESLSIAYDMLDNKKPIYAGGFEHETYPYEGHAWVIDGYMERERLRLETYENSAGDQRIEFKTETGKLLHCNWGWCGSCDGYFIENVFDLGNRISTDNIIDENIEDEVLTINYKFYNTIITY